MFLRIILRRFAIFAALAATGASARAESVDAFSFHMPSEPTTIDPSMVSSFEPSYFLHSIRRGLYRYDSGDPRGADARGLVPEDAEICRWRGDRRLRCALKPALRWSDGSPIAAADYARGFARATSPIAKGAAAELLVNVRRVRAIGKREIEFAFRKADPEFLYKLCSSLLAPMPAGAPAAPGPAASAALTNGPYRIAGWTRGKRIRLESNLFFRAGAGAADRPPVEIFFIEDDQTALDLYRRGTLSYLRRLPTTYAAAYRTRADFYRVPTMRFDYLGFGPELEAYPRAREAFSKSLDFDEIAKIFAAVTRPGCPAIREDLLDRQRCVNFDVAAAKAAWATLPPEVRARRWIFKFSKLGGDDRAKGAEWMQAQWRKNLGANVELQQTENGLYLAELRARPPALFRKGVGLERPTCLAALETFAPDGPENYARVADKGFAGILSALARAKSAEEKRRLCGQGAQALLDRALIVPEGRVAFSILASPRFQGWRLNELNQFDLSELRSAPPPR